MTVSAVEFDDLARRLNARARDLGLTPPYWKSMPWDGIDRDITRRPNEAPTVRIKLHNRTGDAVIDDMVDGILVANRRPTTTALRARLKEALC